MLDRVRRGNFRARPRNARLEIVAPLQNGFNSTQGSLGCGLPGSIRPSRPGSRQGIGRAPPPPEPHTGDDLPSCAAGSAILFSPSRQAPATGALYGGRDMSGVNKVILVGNL